MMNTELDFTITPQPSETTCGAACLHALYRYYGLAVRLDEVVDGVQTIPGGGTLTSLLGLDALQRGFGATIYTCDVRLFDPSWFEQSVIPLRHLMVAQRESKNDPMLHVATDAYLRYLELGGVVRMVDLSAKLIGELLSNGSPIVAGLSATWLYRLKRDRQDDMREDPIGGEPTGHFVVIHSLDEESGTALVADPYPYVPGPVREPNIVTIDRLICAILMGVITYDAKLLVLQPPERRV